jgi:YD repeat-containing protein
MTKKTLLVSLLLVAVITGAIVAFVLWDEARTSRRLSEEAEAIGLTGTPTKWQSGDRNESGHTVTFAYTAGDQVITKTLNEITWFKPEARYKVCYNPADPNDAKLYLADHRCGQ